MSMKSSLSLLAATALLSMAAQPSFAAAVSTFDTDAEGWVVGDIGGAGAIGGTTEAPTHHATGGNPGGYISTTDDFDISAFIAPSSYTGDQSAFLGGTLTFSLQDLVASDNTNYPTVVLYSGGTSIEFTASHPALNGDWTTYSVSLSAPGWTNYPGGENNGATAVGAAAFATALGNITNLAIEADWHTGDDLTGLDSVALNAPATATTPLPAALPLFASGLGALGVVARRRRRLPA